MSLFMSFISCKNNGKYGYLCGCKLSNNTSISDIALFHLPKRSSKDTIARQTQERKRSKAVRVYHVHFEEILEIYCNLIFICIICWFILNFFIFSMSYSIGHRESYKRTMLYQQCAIKIKKTANKRNICKETNMRRCIWTLSKIKKPWIWAE